MIMVLGGSKKEVIKNIKKNIENNELNKKVEVNDPILNLTEINKLTSNFYKIRKNKLFFFIKSLPSKLINRFFLLKIRKDITVIGLENIKKIKTGAIITCNHINPFDNLIVKNAIKNDINIVIQDTNLALKGLLGYIMNYSNVIPISKSPNYIIDKFYPNLKRALNSNKFVLIYPEEEMWFNYKKPRPCKKGAYKFATEFDVPIISCFIKMIETPNKDNDEFNKVKYDIYILKPIYKDYTKSLRENIKRMAQIDYNQKKEAYEKCYGKKLNYEFELTDIVGYKKKDI